MSVAELFKKYNIDDSHSNSKWEPSIDNWMSVEIYRLMHDGNSPEPGDTSTNWITDFLDKCQTDTDWWVNVIMIRKDWGSLYLTAKRLVFRHSNELIL